MAKLRINGDTSGYVELTVPAVAGNTTLDITAPTFSGEIKTTTGSNTIALSTDGNIEMTRSGGGAYIDFKNSIGEDFDTRIQSLNDGFSFFTGGSTSSAIRMALDSSGRFTIPNQPAFQVWADYSQTTPTHVIFNQVVYNNGGHYNSSNGYFTAPVSGKYYFHGQTIMTATGGWWFRKNGVQQNGPSPYCSSPPGWENLSASIVLNLTAGDYVSIGVYTGAWYGSTGNIHNTFTGYLIG